MKYFKEHEFACHCCGKVVLSPDLARVCDEIREQAGVPVTVISGYRCSKHNAEVKGKSGSYHPTGEAADLRAKGLPLTKFLTIAAGIPEVFSGGLGLYPDEKDYFIHVDVRGTKARWGRLDGEYVGIAAAWEVAKKREGSA